MERNQVETNKRLEENNKRLDDVMKSNMNLQQMITSVLNSFSGTDTRKDGVVEKCRVQGIGETSENVQRRMSDVDAGSGDKKKSKTWWDDMCQQSGDEDLPNFQGNKHYSASARRMSQVSLYVRNQKFNLGEYNLNCTVNQSPC